VKFITAKLVNQACLCMLLLGLLLCAGMSHAINNYYVSPSGSGTACTQASPCATINQAHSTLTVGTSGICTAGSGWLSVSGAGACVHVASGNYTGSITTTKSGGSTTRIVYISDTRNGAKITDPNWQTGGSYVDIDGFDMTGPTNSTTAIALMAASYQRIQYNYIHSFGITQCGYNGTISLLNGPDLHNMINGNVIRQSGDYNYNSNHCLNHQGIYDEGDATIITNNIISGITGMGIKRNMITAAHGQGCDPGIISNNTVFNNGGGIIMTEDSDAGFECAFDYWTVTNNIVVMNGVDVPGGSANGARGLWYYDVGGSSTGASTNNFVSNNLIYGNQFSDLSHHFVSCGTSATGSTPVVGVSISSTANAGCPADNSYTDSPSNTSATAATFVNFQFDGNSAPASSYDPANYELKSGSNAINHGTTTCAASPGISPCTPSTDFIGVARLSGSTVDIGAWSVAGVASVPSAPTGLTASAQ
jgi:hypothetical protein